MKTLPVRERLLTALFLTVGIAATGVGLISPARVQAQSSSIPAKCLANAASPGCEPYIGTICTLIPAKCPGSSSLAPVSAGTTK